MLTYLKMMTNCLITSTILIFSSSFGCSPDRLRLSISYLNRGWRRLRRTLCFAEDIMHFGIIALRQLSLSVIFGLALTEIQKWPPSLRTLLKDETAVLPLLFWQFGFCSAFFYFLGPLNFEVIFGLPLTAIEKLPLNLIAVMP